MIKILVSAREYRSTSNFFQNTSLTAIYRLYRVKSVFSTYFSIEKRYLHYKPCLLTKLSSRKSCELFAFSSEKKRFFDLNTELNFLSTRQGLSIEASGRGKNFWLIFWLGKKVEIFSTCRVDKKFAVSEFFLSDFWPKTA